MVSGVQFVMIAGISEIVMSYVDNSDTCKYLMHEVELSWVV